MNFLRLCQKTTNFEFTKISLKNASIKPFEFKKIKANFINIFKNFSIYEQFYLLSHIFFKFVVITSIR